MIRKTPSVQTFRKVNEMLRMWFLVLLLLPPSLPALAGDQGPILNEISAMGIRTFLDEDGEQEDWIEIKNPTGQAIPLAGWSLSDDPDNPARWVFPDVSIPPQGFLVVFASQKNRTPTSGPLHTDFGLGSEGEFLALYDPLGTAVDSFDPAFPLQRDGYSYGLHPDTGERVFFSSPTPGAENDASGAFSEFLGTSLSFDPPRGNYEGEGSFFVQIDADDPEAVIRYTTDYTTPGWENGQTYTGPILIDQNASLRAVALKEGFGPSWVETHTYFLTLTTEQKSLPIMVIVTDPENLDGPDGIRHPDNLQGRGRLWERQASMEYFDLENGAANQINSGIRLHGQLGRTGTSKKPYRLYFREDYGDPSLEFLPIPEAGVQSFKRIVLRGGVQDLNPFVHDELARRTFGRMGQASSHGTFVQFFLNGVHWRQYNPVERYDEYFLNDYHGGGLDWDMVRHSGLASGDLVEWNALLDLVKNADLSDPDQYREVTRRLDVVNFADYLLLNTFAGTEDWPNNNWTAARLRNPGSRFRFYVWDAEQSFARANSNYHNSFDEQLEVLDVPIGHIYRGLKVNPDFQRVMASRFRKHFYEDGALGDDRVMKLYLDLRYIIRGALPNMVNRIPFLWIPGRRYNLEKHLFDKNFLEFVDLPKTGDLTPQPLPALDSTPPPSGPDIVPDGFIGVQDLLELLREKRKFDSSAGFSRLGFRDESWERWDYSVGLGDLSLATSDFDGDGSLDLAFANNSFGTISVLLNDGNGGFSEPVRSPGRIGSEVLGAGDLDGDGLADVVVADRVLLQQSLTSYRNLGDGVLSPISTLPINRTDGARFLFPRALSLKDLDADGDSDVVIQHESSIKNSQGRGAPQNAVGIYENLGDGMLAHSASLFGGSAELMARECLLVEDFDGDDDLDIVVLDGDNGLLIAEHLGGLTFAQPRTLAKVGLLRYLSLVALDLNGDGALDILVSALGNPDVNALINDGSGGFTADNAFRVNADLPETLHTGDFNSDSHPDLLIINRSPVFLVPKGNVDVMLNDGSGKFSRSKRLIPAAYDPMPRSIASGDFDADGDRDFATLDRYNGVLSVFRNQITPSSPSADINSDSRIDFLDFLEIQPLWGTEISGP